MQRRGRGRKKPLIRNAARSRIDTLYNLSMEKAKEGDLKLAREYLTLARKISMRYTVRIPADMKRITCKGCMTPLVPGITSRIRFRNGKETITCLECGKIKRYELRRDISEE
jgi:ribonuclease P protein subunit RPR2